MAVDFLTFAIGSVDRAAVSVSPDLSATMVNARLQENPGPQFAAQLALTSAVAQPSNVTSDLSVAKKFEAIFVAQMMTSILPKDSEYFGEGFSGDAWRSMMSEQLANVAVKQTDFGIAALIEQDFANQSDIKSSGPSVESSVSNNLVGAPFERRGP